MLEVPVFIINGFLESGKTTLIKNIINQDSEVQKVDTLLICCEQGETEYDEEFLKENKVRIEYIESEEDLTKEFLEKVDKEFEPARVVIEYNSFFKLSNLELPEIYVVGQIISLIDCSTFKIYFNNMKQIFNDMVRDADLVIFNRCDGDYDLSSYRRIIRSLNQNGQIAFEGKDGSLTEMLAEDLPYDLTKDEIKLHETDYPIFYMDAFDNYERYYNKEITFLAMLMELEDAPKDHFLPGRKIMTCCAEDIRFLGFEAINETKETIKNNEWAMVTVKLTHEYSSLSGNEEVILHAIKIVKCKPPTGDDVLSFT